MINYATCYLVSCGPGSELASQARRPFLQPNRMANREQVRQTPHGTIRHKSLSYPRKGAIFVQLPVTRRYNSNVTRYCASRSRDQLIPAAIQYPSDPVFCILRKRFIFCTSCNEILHTRGILGAKKCFCADVPTLYFRIIY